MSVTILNHPVVHHHLTTLRAKETTSEQFRFAIGRLTTMLAYEAARDLTTAPKEIETPLTTTTAQCLNQRVGLVPIIRAGMGMVEPMLQLLPDAEVWHLGLYRDESTAQPIEYYNKLPQSEPLDVAMILDPMLATGGSARLAIEKLATWSVQQIKLLSIISSEDGIKRIQAESPNTQIFTCVVDGELNAQKFIVPGLGDAGDRIFNT